jgi:uracil-DNA glycosylase
VSSRAGNRLVEPIGRQVDAHSGEWAPLLRDWAASDAGRSLIHAVDARLAAGATIYPADVFRALALTPLSQVRVLILGQDPYHGPGQAEGLAFSVPAGQRLPPSLRNIVQELQRDLGLAVPLSGSLLDWARQGVLLLNTSLSVEEACPGSHAKLGWQVLTDKIVAAVADHPRPKVFMFWGAHAQAKAPLVLGAAAGARHLVLQCNHPSPLSATRAPLPFVGCGHFGRAHAFLSAAEPGLPAPDWRLDLPPAHCDEVRVDTER